MRTPASGSTNYFAGNSLSLDYSAANQLVGLAIKYPAAGAVRVDNLKLNGGGIFNGVGSTMSVYGNITVLTNSFLDPQANGRVLAIYAPISGGSTNTIGLRASAGSAGGTVQLLADNSGYAGNWYTWGIGDSVPGAALQVGNGGTSGNLGRGSVTNDYSLIFNRADNITVSNTISGPGSVVQAGSGTLTLTGANTYSGVTSNNAGILSFSSMGNLGTGDITFAGGTLQFAPGNSTDISVRNITLTGNGGTLDVGANNVMLANSIGNSGAGALTKAGSGKLTLTSAPSYTGNTAVSAGTLILGANASLANSPVISLAGGSSLDVSAVSGFSLASGQTLAGSGTVIGAITSVSGATISPGSATNGTLTVNGNAALGSCTLAYNLNAPNVTGGTNDLFVVNGNLNLSPAISLNLVFPGGLPVTGTYTLCQCTGTLTGDPSDFATSLGSYVVTFALNTATLPRTITMTIAGLPQSLRWTGQTTSDWDTTTLNWTNLIGLTNTIFSPGDTVRFDDSSSQTSVNITASMLPGQTTVNTTSTYTFSGAGSIGGPGNLVKSGSGTLILDLTNNYAGSTVIQNGFIQIGNGDATGSFGVGPVTNNGAVLLNRSDAIGVLPNSISGTGALTNIGTGAVTLSGSNSYSGGTVVSAGTLKFGSPTALGATNGSTIVADGAVLDLNGQTNATEVVTITDVGIGTGALVNNNTTNAAFNGTITLAGDAAIGGSGNMSLNAIISGAFALTKAGGGMTTLTGSNSFTGGTVVNSGILALANGFALGSSSVTVNSGNTVLQLNGGITVTGLSLLNNNGSTGANGVESNTGSNVWAGPATLGVDFARFGSASNAVLNLAGIVDDGANGYGFRVRGGDGTGIVQLSAANTYLGNTSVDVGVLRLGNAQALPGSTSVGVNNLSGAVLDLAGFSPQIMGLTGIGLVTNSASSVSTLTLNTSNAVNYLTLDGVSYGNGGLGSNNFFGVIAGNVTLTKAGDPGTVLLLTNANTYTGNTTVNAGTLEIVQPTLAQSSTVTVASGAVLQLDFAVTNTVAGLVLNGFNKAPGIYNGTTASPYLAGTGSLLVKLPVATNPTNIVFSVNGNNLNLSWPADHKGWTLQTNSVNLANTNYWFPYPGSAALTNVVITIDPTKANVFYRLVYP